MKISYSNNSCILYSQSTLPQIWHHKLYHPIRSLCIIWNLGMVNLLVKRSAFWKSVLTLTIFSDWCLICLLKKWYLVSICFDLGVILKVLARVSAPLLSSNMVEWVCTCCWETPRFSSTSSTGILVGIVDWDKAIYSASNIDIAISLCYLLVQTREHLFNINMYPVWDFTWTGSWSSLNVQNPAKSASL